MKTFPVLAHENNIPHDFLWSVMGKIGMQKLRLSDEEAELILAEVRKIGIQQPKAKPVHYLPERTRENIDDQSIVYFIISRQTARVKIGHTSSIRQRLSSIQNGSGHLLEVAWTTRGGCNLEKAFHERFREYRTIGEWFRYEGRLKKFINERTQNQDIDKDLTVEIIDEETWLGKFKKAVAASEERQRSVFLADDLRGGPYAKLKIRINDIAAALAFKEYPPHDYRKIAKNYLEEIGYKNTIIREDGRSIRIWVKKFEE